VADAKGVPAYVCPGCKTRILFGTKTQPPPARCPDCNRRLWIPTALDEIPPEWLRPPDSSGPCGRQ